MRLRPVCPLFAQKKITVVFDQHLYVFAVIGGYESPCRDCSSKRPANHESLRVHYCRASSSRPTFNSTMQAVVGPALYTWPDYGQQRRHRSCPYVRIAGIRRTSAQGVWDLPRPHQTRQLKPSSVSGCWQLRRMVSILPRGRGTERQQSVQAEVCITQEPLAQAIGDKTDDSSARQFSLPP